ncbi:glycosyltransferase family 39 protein [Salegentibacter agarivorans]
MHSFKKLNLFWAIVLILLFFFSVNGAYISADAPYYLSVARDISEGLIPYKDIKSIYTPLMMYLNAIIFEVFKKPSYHIFLIFQYIVIGLSGFTLYKICKKIKANSALSLFLTLFFLISVLSSDGIYINLEVYVCLCVLGSFYFYLEKKVFLSGLILALGILFKQYGVLNFIPFLILIFLTDKETVTKNIILFLSGSILLGIIFLTYFIFIENIRLTDLFLQLSGQGYGEKGIGLDKSLLSILVGSKVFVLIILTLIFLKIDLIKDKLNLVLVIGILVNLIPVLIQNFPHYFLLTFPYIFILIAYNSRELSFKWFILSNLSLILIASFLFLRINRYQDKYEEQVTISKKMEEAYPRGSEVFLLGEIRYLYFLNDYRNPLLNEVGYSYLFYPDKKFKKENTVLELDQLN